MDEFYDNELNKNKQESNTKIEFDVDNLEICADITTETKENVIKNDIFNGMTTNEAANCDQHSVTNVYEEQNYKSNEEKPVEVYIKTNNLYEIVEINSDIFINDKSEWIKIDEGYGDKFAHAQSQYFDDFLIKDNGQYNYKFENGKVVKNN